MTQKLPTTGAQVLMGRALKVLAGNGANNDWPIMWIWWSDRAIESGTIDLFYGQHQGTASRANQAVAYMEYRAVSTDTFDPRSCRPSGFTAVPGSSMSNTHATDFLCFPLSVTVPVSKGDRGLLVRFCKCKAAEFAQLWRIDDLKATSPLTPIIRADHSQTTSLSGLKNHSSQSSIDGPASNR